MTRAGLALALLVAAALPLLGAPGLAERLPAALAAWRALPAGAVAAAVALFATSAPVLGRSDDPRRLAWWTLAPAFAPACLLGAAPDGGGVGAVLVLLLAALCARARATTRASVWSLVWWCAFALPVLAGEAFGAVALGAGPLASAARLSPFDAVRAAGGGAFVWTGLAVGLAVAVLAPLVAPRRVAEAGA
jgi:hypothetical protein